MWLTCNSHVIHIWLTHNVNTTDFQVSVAQPGKCRRRLARPSVLLLIRYALQTTSPSVDGVARRRQSTSFCVFDKTRGWRGRFGDVSDHCGRDIWFYQTQKKPFPGAMLSQKDFWRVPTWKRCIIYIFLFRLVLNKHATSKYYEWTSEEYHLTKKLFYRSVLLTPYLHSLTPITLTRTPGSKRRTER